MAGAIPAKRKWADVATVSLVVGESKTAFHVHEADLFEASPFFKAAFTSDFRESAERSMMLPEDDENIFELFVEWLYHRCYELSLRPTIPDEDVFVQPVKLYVLADKYDVRSLKNLVVSKLFIAFKQHHYVPKLSTFACAYEHTAQSSPIRKLLADKLTRLSVTVYQQADVQTWLRNHPDVSAELNTSFAKYIAKQIYLFVEEMPECYIDKEAESGK